MKFKSLFILTLLLLNLFNFSLAGGANDFYGISLTQGFKDIENHNPIMTQKFSADPGVLEYEGRIYVYSTNDGILQNFKPASNVYSQITTINIMSSADLVNWTDHGTYQVAGPDGIASWASNSWAPAACHKNIDGEEKFFIYFANNASGIGVITSDTPIGPWFDPLGRPLISRQTYNCNVEWLFDPAVLVDEDGTGYLYFGGGVPSGKESYPGTMRVIKLGYDMISLGGSAVTLTAPWSYEDSGINRIGNTYYYSYCTNWNGGPYGNAKIAWMTSNKAIGPYRYQATCFNNPGEFFGSVGNNHHSIISFKNKFYIFYHSEWLNKQAYGAALGYRTTHVDEMPFSNDRFGNAKGTLNGVNQLFNFMPYQKSFFNTMAWQAGINVYGTNWPAVSYNRGDWTGVSNVDFGNGAKSITVNGGSINGATIRISINSPTGTVIGYVTIPATGDYWKPVDVTASISGASGVKNLFFVSSGDVVLNTYQFSS